MSATMPSGVLGDEPLHATAASNISVTPRAVMTRVCLIMVAPLALIDAPPDLGIPPHRTYTLSV